MGRRAVSLVLAAGLAVAACGGGSESSSTGAPSEPSTSSTAAAATADANVGSTTQPSTAAQASAPATPTSRPGPVNQTVVDDPSGFRVTFVIADALEFRSTDAIRFQVTVTNIANSTRYVSAEQPAQFAIAVEGASSALWSDQSCRKGSPIDQIPAPIPLEPGEDLRFTAAYPRDESCRIDPGAYVSGARVEVCPPETLEPTANGQPICNRAKNEILTSAPLRIRIKP